jgi:hypothetical protein
MLHSVVFCPLSDADASEMLDVVSGLKYLHVDIGIIGSDIKAVTYRSHCCLLLMLIPVLEEHTLFLQKDGP